MVYVGVEHGMYFLVQLGIVAMCFPWGARPSRGTDFPTAGIVHAEASKAVSNDEADELDRLAALRSCSMDTLPPMDSEDDGDMADDGSDCREGRFAAPTLVSIARSKPHLAIEEVRREHFHTLVAKEVPQEIGAVVSCLVGAVMQAHGGCAVAIAPKAAPCSLRGVARADYRGADRGYVTDRLAGASVEGPVFAEAVRRFTPHAPGDRRPPGHEAAGKPKDGFLALVDTDGERPKCAVKILGMRPAPVRWNDVGTRHSTSMNLCWALRGTPAAVVVCSDSGSVHVILSKGSGIKAIKTLI